MLIVMQLAILVVLLFVDIDECDSSTSVCNEHATCTNTPGSYECHCNSGFSENGFICEGI